MSSNCTLESFVLSYAVAFNVSIILPALCYALLRESEANCHILSVIEQLTALYALVSYFPQSRFFHVSFENVCLRVCSHPESASFIVNTNFWHHINSSIQSTLTTAVISTSARISHSTTNYQHDIGFSVGWNTLCWVAAHCHKSFYLTVSTGDEI